MKHIEAMKLALEACKRVPTMSVYATEKLNEVEAILDQAIEQAEQEQPVAIIASLMPAERNTLIEEGHSLHDALYTAPPSRKPLTAMEVYDVVRDAYLDWHTGFALGEDENRFVVFARAIEAAHGIKGEA